MKIKVNKLFKLEWDIFKIILKIRIMNLLGNKK